MVLVCIKLLLSILVFMDIWVVSSAFVIATNAAIKSPVIHVLDLYTLICTHIPPGEELFGYRVNTNRPFVFPLTWMIKKKK